MIIGWLSRLFERYRPQQSRGAGVVDSTHEAAPGDKDDGLERQAELADAVKAKAAFAAMFTDADDRVLYEELRDEAFQIMRTIDDAFYASFAQHQLIRLCLGAGEPERVVALMAEVEDEFIVDEIYDEFPELEPAIRNVADEHAR